MKIYLIRHGETKWNEKGLLQGNTDIELNSNGREIAGITGMRLKDTPIDKIFSSPLIRAYETACLLRGYRNIEIERNELLRELCFGIYEGRKVRPMIEDKNHPFHNFFEKPGLYTAPKDGETLEHIVGRAEKFMKTEIEAKADLYENVMIVAHGAMNQAIMTYINHNEIKDFWKCGLQKNCEITTIDYSNNQYTIAL